MIAWSPDRQARANIANNVLPAYAACGESNCAYLPGCEQIMHNYTLFSSDNIHPNDAGYQLLAGAIVSAIKTGAYAAQFAYNSIELAPAGIATNIHGVDFQSAFMQTPGPLQSRRQQTDR